MASLIESYKLISTDSNFFAKIGIFSLIPFAIYTLIDEKILSFKGSDTLLLIMLATIYLGILFQTLSNSIQEKAELLPNYNIFKSFVVGLKGLISTGPFIILTLLIYKKFFLILDTTLIQSKIILVIVSLILMGLLISSIIFYSKNLKIYDGLNIKKILKNFHEVIPYLAITIIVCALVNLIISLPIGFMIYGLFHVGKILNFAISTIITTNLLCLFQNFSQLYFEQFKD
jgi:hypothetical protein